MSFFVNNNKNNANKMNNSGYTNERSLFTLKPV